MPGRITNWFSRLSNWKLRTRGLTQVAEHGIQQEENISGALVRFEPYVLKIQSVLLWQNPLITAFCVLIVNILFGVVVIAHCKFFVTLFSAALLLLMYDLIFETVEPVIYNSATTQDTSSQSHHQNIRMMSIQEISHYLNRAYNTMRDYFIWLKTLRKEQPGVFCSGMCLCFLVLTFIGRTVPGVLILYITLMSIMVGPGICLYILPPCVLHRLQTICSSLKDTDSEVEEFLPEQTGENLAVFQLAGELMEEPQRDSLLPEELNLDLDAPDTSATQTSYMAGMIVMPSHDEGSTDGLDVSDFDLSAPPSQLGNNNTDGKQERVLNDSDTDEEVVGEINFQSSHFNGDSSEEDEKLFTQGLSFPEPSDQVPPGLATTVVQAVAKNISSLGIMGQSLLANVISVNTVPQPIRREPSPTTSEESDDFEMISQDDLS